MATSATMAWGYEGEQHTVVLSVMRSGSSDDVSAMSAHQITSAVEKYRWSPLGRSDVLVMEIALGVEHPKALWFMPLWVTGHQALMTPSVSCHRQSTQMTEFPCCRFWSDLWLSS